MFSRTLCSSQRQGIQGQGLGTKAKDFVIKTKTKATALWPRGTSRTRPSPRGHITGCSDLDLLHLDLESVIVHFELIMFFISWAVSPKCHIHTVDHVILKCVILTSSVVDVWQYVVTNNIFTKLHNCVAICSSRVHAHTVLNTWLRCVQQKWSNLPSYIEQSKKKIWLAYWWHDCISRYHRSYVYCQTERRATPLSFCTVNLEWL